MNLELRSVGLHAFAKGVEALQEIRTQRPAGLDLDGNYAQIVITTCNL